MSKREIYNFSPGPAALPKEVVLKVKQELADYAGLGYSILEMSHRSKTFVKIIEDCKRKLLNFLNLASGYHVLFFQGGATTEFFRVAYNLLGAGKTADYLETGVWVKKAIQEANNVSQVKVVASSKDEGFSYIPPLDGVEFSPEAEYIYLCSNNTVVGTQYKTFPKPHHGNYLVGDFTSDILSRECDLKDFGVIFAGAQKNLGPAGLVVVILRDDVLKKCRTDISGINSYLTMQEQNSLYNTAPVFQIYFMNLVLDWLEEQGGVKNISKTNAQKASMLYDVIDEHDLFVPTASREHRSLMNVTFKIAREDLTDLFVREAEEVGLVNLKGHRLVGGIRVSNYNAMPLSGIEKLCDFMKKFSQKN